MVRGADKVEASTLPGAQKTEEALTLSGAHEREEALSLSGAQEFGGLGDFLGGGTGRRGIREPLGGSTGERDLDGSGEQDSVVPGEWDPVGLAQVTEPHPSLQMKLSLLDLLEVQSFFQVWWRTQMQAGS